MSEQYLVYDHGEHVETYTSLVPAVLDLLACACEDDKGLDVKIVDSEGDIHRLVVETHFISRHSRHVAVIDLKENTINHYNCEYQFKENGEYDQTEIMNMNSGRKLYRNMTQVGDTTAPQER